MPDSATNCGKASTTGWSKPTTQCSKSFAVAMMPHFAKLTSKLKSAKPTSDEKPAGRPREKATKPKVRPPGPQRPTANHASAQATRLESQDSAAQSAPKRSVAKDANRGKSGRELFVQWQRLADYFPSLHPGIF